MPDKKYYEAHFPIFKQGDDLHSAWVAASAKLKGIDAESWEDLRAALKPHLVEHQQGLPEASADAFVGYAEQLEEAAKIARQLAGVAKEYGLEIANADTHHVSVYVDPEVGERLVTEGLIHHDPFDDDDDEDEDDEFNESDDDVTDPQRPV